MSVYTPVSHEQLTVWLTRFPLGQLLSIDGIAEGVQNSNFFVDTATGRFVLTLFERVDPALLPFYIGLMAHLSARGIPCPAPLAAIDGSLLGELNGRPAALFSRLGGHSVTEPTPAQCAAVGRALAELHLAGQDFPGPAHPRGSDWIARTATKLMPRLPADDAALLASELAFQQKAAPALLRGVIHADLFRDNVLFAEAGDGAGIGGLLDFYFAGTGELLFDLAIVANDWCIDASGELDDARTRSLLAAYHALRPLTADECAAWPRLLRASALRFWLSRLEDFHCPLPGEVVTVRNPDDYRRILKQRIALGNLPISPMQLA